VALTRVAAVALAACGLGDTGGVVNQLASADKPPPAAPVLGAVFGVLAFTAAALLLRGSRRGITLGILSRVGDIALLGGALLAGGFADEPTAHAAAAAAQGGLSVATLLVLLLVVLRARSTRAQSRPLPGGDPA